MLYIDVRDSNNINASTIVLSGTGSNNSGNNTNCDFVNSTPNTPTELGPSEVVSGNVISDYTPSFTFRTRDQLNPLDTLSYNIQISSSFDFSNLVVDYTSALTNQGIKTFTVGQAAGSGTYTIGS